MSEPLIDILMATYNGELFIAEQIESIQHQTYTNWRLLISDDCSTDKTLEIVRRYAKQDARLEIVSEGVKHGGAKGNFISLMAITEAPYCMFCDQDDVWRPNKIEVELKTLLENENIFGCNCPLMVHSDLELIDGAGISLNSRMSETLSIDPNTASPLQLFLSGVATGCTIGVNRACIKKALKCSDIEDVIMHDWWIALVAETLGNRVFIQSPLVFYRQHSGNAIGASTFSLKSSARSYIDEFKNRGVSGLVTRIVDCEKRRIVQARAFLDTYERDLDLDSRHQLEILVGLPYFSLFRRLFVVGRYGLWRSGLRRKLKQFVSLCLIGWQYKCLE